MFPAKNGRRSFLPRPFTLRAFPVPGGRHAGRSKLDAASEIEAAAKRVIITCGEAAAGKLSIGDLSAKFNVGRRNFDRRFIKATGNTPIEYAQRVKIEIAKKAFETSRKTINEVMYEVGYSDVKAFREVFRKITGMSPLEYRGKYNKEAVF